MSLFKLFGQRKPNADTYWEFDSTKHFKPHLSRADFYRLTGFEFGWFVLEPLSQYIQDPRFEAERGKSFSYAQKALYYWWYVDAQVTNGGFVQYYFNGMGKYTPATIKALKHIGDHQMAELVHRSYELYLAESKKIKNAQLDGLEGLSGLYKEIEDFESLDDAYYQVNDATMRIIENYFRQHPDEVCKDEYGQDYDMTFSGECTAYYPNKQLKESYTVENGVIVSPYKSYHKNGKPKEAIHYENGVQTGERDEYFENGNLKYSIRVKASLGQHAHLWYYENGNPKKLEHKKSGQDDRIGEYKEWYENGQLAESATYISPIDKEGWWIKYYPDGSKKSEAEMKDGDFLLHNCWNEKGEQVLKDGSGLYVYEFNAWEGQFYQYKQEYKNYKRHGQQHTYLNGALSLYQEMENGKEHGITRSYESDGRLREEIVYNHGEEVSRTKY